MKKKNEEDLSMFEDAKQFVALLVPMTQNSFPLIQKKMSINKPKFVNYVDREQLEKFCKDQGLNLDPTSTDKVKKELDITDEIMAQTFKAFLIEENLNQKREKKAVQDALNKDAKKKDPKKQDQPVTLVTEEKVYTKNFDQLFIFQDYPMTSQDFDQLSKIGVKIDMVIKLNENLDNYQVQEQKEVEEEEEENPQETQVQIINYDNQALQNIKLNQKKSQRRDPIRDVYFHEIAFEDSQEDFCDQLCEEISAISIEKEAFNQWLKSKLEISLEKIQKKYNIEEQQQKIKESIEREQNADLENEERQKQFVKKKKTDQDIQDDENYQKQKEQEEELRIKLKKEIDQIIKKEDEKFLKTFNEQISTIKDENQTIGIILECLLEEMRADRLQSDQNDQNDEEDISELQSFFESQKSEYLKNPEQNYLQTEIKKQLKKDENILLNFQDIFQRKCLDSKFKSGDKSYDREKLITDRIQYPGINRNCMPQIPEISEHLQRLNLCENLVFQDNNTKYQIQNNLDLFTKMCLQNLNANYDFSDRLYVERLDQNMLKQIIYNSFIQEKEIFTQYNMNDDTLFLVIANKMVQGRIRRQKQQMDWKVLPNFENYTKLFKNSQQQTFYNFDYQILGDISQKNKHIMPCNDGLIKVLTNKIGNLKQKSFKVIKENVTFNLIDDKFNSLFDNDTRIQVERQNGILNTTFCLKNGLMIKLLPDNEILQSYQHSSQIIDEKNRLILSKGSVIKYMNDGQTIILFANGNVAKKNKGQDNYVTTNNKGLQSLQSQLEDVPSVVRKDYDYTNADVLLREDNVQVVWYKCGTIYTLHEDGTKILTKNDKTIIVEHPDYSTVTIKNKQSIIDFFDESRAIMEFDNINIYIKDKTQIGVSPDGIVNLFFTDNTKYEVDINKCQLNHKDQQKNEFKIKDYKQECIIQQSKQILSEIQDYQESVNSSENEFIPEYLKDKEIELDEFYQPQLIVIKGDQVLQYLCEKQIHNFIENQEMIQQINRTDFNENIFLVQDIPFQRIQSIDLDVPPMVNETHKNKSKGNTTLVRNLFQFKEIDFDKFNEWKYNYEVWKQQNQRGLVEWGFKTQRLPNEKQQEIEIYKQIIKLRQQDFTQESYQKFIQSQEFQSLLNKFQEDFLLASQPKVKILQQKLFTRNKINKMNLLGKKLQKNMFEHLQDLNPLEVEVPLCFIECYFKTYEGILAMEKMPQIPPPNKKKRIIEQPNAQEQQEDQNQSMEIQEIPQTIQPNETKFKTKSFKQTYKPSVFQIEEEEVIKIEKHRKLQSVHHCQQKTKDYNIYGGKRDLQQKVPCLLRTTPDTKVNERFITQDSNWDNRCKISSMNNRLYMKAQNIQQKRKQGPHQTLQDLQDKKNTVLNLIEKDNMGLINDIHDNLKRNVLITPVKARFGCLQSGKLYQMKISVKNEDVMAQRITVRQCSTKYAKAFQAELGPIAMGMVRDIIVHLDAEVDIQGLFEDKFEIVTKSEIFTIPISAQILDSYEFMEKDQQNLLHKNKQLMKPNVQEVSKEKSEMKFLDSTTSDNKLPKIQQFDKNTKIEYKNLDNIISIIDN